MGVTSSVPASAGDPNAALEFSITQSVVIGTRADSKAVRTDASKPSRGRSETHREYCLSLVLLACASRTCAAVPLLDTRRASGLDTRFGFIQHPVQGPCLQHTKVSRSYTQGTCLLQRAAQLSSTLLVVREHLLHRRGQYRLY